MADNITDIKHNYAHVLADMKKAALQGNRNPQSITLIVVTKFQPVEKIETLLQLGQHHFGESRIEEIEKKWLPILKSYPDVKLHFIGNIQSRKIKNIVEYCHYIHSLDDLNHAINIKQECVKQNKDLSCFIQINIGEEKQKGGIDITELPKFLETCREINLPIIGLMCIPPHNQDPTPYFKKMQALTKTYQFDALSLGMSDDYELAIHFDATMLRVGSKILGERGRF